MFKIYNNEITQSCYIMLIIKTISFTATSHDVKGVGRSQSKF